MQRLRSRRTTLKILQVYTRIWGRVLGSRISRVPAEPSYFTCRVSPGPMTTLNLIIYTPALYLISIKEGQRGSLIFAVCADLVWTKMTVLLEDFGTCVDKDLGRVLGSEGSRKLIGLYKGLGSSFRVRRISGYPEPSIFMCLVCRDRGQPVL